LSDQTTAAPTFVRALNKANLRTNTRTSRCAPDWPDLRVDKETTPAGPPRSPFHISQQSRGRSDRGEQWMIPGVATCSCVAGNKSMGALAFASQHCRIASVLADHDEGWRLSLSAAYPNAAFTLIRPEAEEKPGEEFRLKASRRALPQRSVEGLAEVQKSNESARSTGVEISGRRLHNRSRSRPPIVEVGRHGQWRGPERQSSN
jgi:hypothetical protein